MKDKHIHVPPSGKDLYYWSVNTTALTNKQNRILALGRILTSYFLLWSNANRRIPVKQMLYENTKSTVMLKESSSSKSLVQTSLQNLRKLWILFCGEEILQWSWTSTTKENWCVYIKTIFTAQLFSHFFYCWNKQEWFVDCQPEFADVLFLIIDTE